MAHVQQMSDSKLTRWWCMKHLTNVEAQWEKLAEDVENWTRWVAIYAGLLETGTGDS